MKKHIKCRNILLQKNLWHTLFNTKFLILIQATYLYFLKREKFSWRIDNFYNPNCFVETLLQVSNHASQSKVLIITIIIIMYIYHVFINALSALRSSGFSVDKEAHHNASASSWSNRSSCLWHAVRDGRFGPCASSHGVGGGSPCHGLVGFQLSHVCGGICLAAGIRCRWTNTQVVHHKSAKSTVSIGYVLWDGYNSKGLNESMRYFVSNCLHCEKF